VGRRFEPRFDASLHARELVPLVAAVAAGPPVDARALDRMVKRHPKAGRGLFRRSEIIAGFRGLGGAARFGLPEPEFLARLRLRPVRTLSGVTPVTLLTRPFPCPGRCVFCPTDARMPKSYLSDEPGAQRALANRFDPYLQTWNRLRAYRDIGHPTAKVELIVLGGTWSAYPSPYQRWFVARALEAATDFGAGRDGRADAGPGPHASEAASWEALLRAQRENERAGARCVGLSLETRPDHVTPEEALRLRRLGATKIQLGVQSLSDAVLAANRRGHDVAATRRAFAILRRFGFKLQAHFMPNLLGATREDDSRGYARLFSDADFRPDELKLYPCLLVETAELMQAWRRGEWRPYPDAELTELLADCLAETPEYCRVTRVVRDFSAHDIAAGTHVANLREVAERRLAERGATPRDIRAREIRGTAFDPARLRLREVAYPTSIGDERFLQFETPDDRLVGFARLSLPGAPAPLPELEGCALLREVHVYGASLELGSRGGAPQHAGLGRRLVERAAALAGAAGFARLAVISAVGTRDYYRALGFTDRHLYQHLEVAG
jgi:elongator complex protein 3